MCVVVGSRQCVHVFVSVCASARASWPFPKSHVQAYTWLMHVSNNVEVAQDAQAVGRP